MNQSLKISTQTLISSVKVHYEVFRGSAGIPLGKNCLTWNIKAEQVESHERPEPILGRLVPFQWMGKHVWKGKVRTSENLLFCKHDQPQTIVKTNPFRGPEISERSATISEEITEHK